MGFGIWDFGFREGVPLRKRFMYFLHYIFKGNMKIKDSLPIGHHLSWDGKVAAERPGKFIYHTRHK